jgi:geranylgeranyl diphosphate synthase type I
MNVLSNTMLVAIEEELQRQVTRQDELRTPDFHEMLTYHMGWTGDGFGAETRGKRLRSLLLLLTSAACGADWQPALPASAAVELVHNFSLIHDDIQDNSDFRRGRLAVWKKWGIPLGINAGDALFVLSNLALLDLVPAYPAESGVKAAIIIQNACLHLTSGQYLDMAYESRTDLTMEDYWEMIGSKTAALFRACSEVGALLGGADYLTQQSFSNFGHYLGLAFQVQDDLLGIWGDSTFTGKSIESDLVSGKKSLPVLFGINKGAKFAQRWRKGMISPNEVPALADLLIEEGALLFTQETIDKIIDMAFQSLRLTNPQGEAGEELFEMLQKITNRNS